MLFPTRCYLIWDKVAQMETLADCEMAWTSFDLNAKIFKHVRNTSETRIHICQKPIKLYEWIFNRFAKPNDKIFDSHLGSMSIVISALKYNLHITGTEISENYFNAGIKRVREYESQYKIF